MQDDIKQIVNKCREKVEGEPVLVGVKTFNGLQIRKFTNRKMQIIFDFGDSVWSMPLTQLYGESVVIGLIKWAEQQFEKKPSKLKRFFSALFSGIFATASDNPEKECM